MTMRASNLLGLAAGLIGLVLSLSAAAEEPAWNMFAARPEAVEAWQDMRFGMFICWGPVSLTGEEIGWSRGAPPWGIRPGVPGGKGPTPVEVYDNLYKTWKPDKFSAREWIQVASDAGAKYVIFLVKHHDGFCLFDTKLTDYKSTAPESAWRVDVMKEIADACHAAGIKLMIYYSQPDWHHPDFFTDRHAKYVEYLHGQVRELLTNYGKIDGLWFDNLRPVSPETAKLWEAEKLFKMARGIQPDLVINNRCGLPGDYDTPENQVGFFQTGRPWETCATLTTQWSWKPNDELRSLAECIQMLVVCATGGGNFALNTGPMPDGRIEPRQAARFREIGQWLKTHGESIYGTRGGPFRAPDEKCRRQEAYAGRFALAGGRWWGGSTHRANVVYLHVLRWPSDTIALPPIPRKIVRYGLLEGGECVVRESPAGIEVEVPAAARDPLDTIVRLELDGPAGSISTAVPPSGSLTIGKKATASNVFQNSAEFQPGRAIDDDPNTRWGCDWGTHSAWLEVDLGEEKSFDRAWISEPYGRVQRFELQTKQGDQWIAFHRGTTIGECCTVRFTPVTTRVVRLNLLETSEGPSIWEFHLFAPERR